MAAQWALVEVLEVIPFYLLPSVVVALGGKLMKIHDDKLKHTIDSFTSIQ